MTDAEKTRPRFTQGWTDGTITFPALVLLVLVMTAAGLGFASIGGTFGTVLVALSLLAVVALLIRWSGSPR